MLRSHFHSICYFLISLVIYFEFFLLYLFHHSSRFTEYILVYHFISTIGLLAIHFCIIVSVVIQEFINTHLYQSSFKSYITLLIRIINTIYFHITLPSLFLYILLFYKFYKPHYIHIFNIQFSFKDISIRKNIWSLPSYLLLLALFTAFIHIQIFICDIFLQCFLYFIMEVW